VSRGTRPHGSVRADTAGSDDLLKRPDAGSYPAPADVKPLWQTGSGAPSNRATSRLDSCQGHVRAVSSAGERPAFTGASSVRSPDGVLPVCPYGCGASDRQLSTRVWRGHAQTASFDRGIVRRRRGDKTEHLGEQGATLEGQHSRSHHRGPRTRRPRTLSRRRSSRPLVATSASEERTTVARPDRAAIYQRRPLPHACVRRMLEVVVNALRQSAQRG
jgi:hypothetical protein